MFERFTDRSRQAVVQAQQEARALGATSLGAEHLLLGILADPDALAVRVLDDLGASAARIRELVTRRSADAGTPADRTTSGTAGLDDAEVEALRAIGIDAEEVVRRVEAELGTSMADPRSSRRTRSGHVPFSPEAKKALELALREAIALKHRYIGTEHLLLGLLRAPRDVVAAVFGELGVGHDQVRAAVVQALRRTG